MILRMSLLQHFLNVNTGRHQTQETLFTPLVSGFQTIYKSPDGAEFVTDEKWIISSFQPPTAASSTSLRYWSCSGCEKGEGRRKVSQYWNKLLLQDEYSEVSQNSKCSLRTEVDSSKNRKISNLHRLLPADNQLQIRVFFYTQICFVQFFNFLNILFFPFLILHDTLPYFCRAFNRTPEHTNSWFVSWPLILYSEIKKVSRNKFTAVRQCKERQVQYSPAVRREKNAYSLIIPSCPA